jgi:hypothetical protein
MVVVLAVGGAGLYVVNGWTNHQASLAVVDYCSSEDQRLDLAIADTEASGLAVFDWMGTLYRARRRYVREICDATVTQLAWWRWNLNRPIQVDIAEATRQEVSATLQRAANGCDEDIAGVENLFTGDAQPEGFSPELVQQLTAMLGAHRQACQNLQTSLADARVGYWPALSATGPEEVSLRLRQLMPQSLAFSSAVPN